MFPKLFAALSFIVEAVMKLKDIYDRVQARKARSMHLRIQILNNQAYSERDPLKRKSMYELHDSLKAEFFRKYSHLYGESE